jgi:hypothetical protein
MGEPVMWWDEASDLPADYIESLKKLSPVEFRKQFQCEFVEDTPPPPPRLSIDPNQPDFHPCYCRVGVRVNVEERNDIEFYDLRQKSFMTTDHRSFLADSIVPYWRYQPSRQQRRAEEAWERKHSR